MLDLGNLKNAIDALERSLAVADAQQDSPDRELRETIRAGVIQNFEVAYEQSWKMLQRWLRENASPERAENPRTRKELFRLAAQYGLIPDPLPWFEYGDARNMSSHTYKEADASYVFGIAEKFLPDAKALLNQLENLG